MNSIFGRHNAAFCMAESKNTAKYPQIFIRVTPFQYNLFEKFRKLGLSAREVLEYSGCPCDKCKGTNITVCSDDTGEEILIPKGILSKRK